MNDMREELRRQIASAKPGHDSFGSFGPDGLVLCVSQEQRDFLLAELSAPQGGEAAVAWAYELAHAIDVSNHKYTKWERYLSWEKPNVPEGSVRNLRALFAVPPPPAVEEEETDRDNAQFNQGVKHTVELLAKALGVDSWTAGDGSEDYDEDLQQTLINVLTVKGLYDPETGAFALLNNPTLPAIGEEEIERKKLIDAMCTPRSGSGVVRRHVELELSCNTQLACKQCGHQNFRICMECDEATNELSTTVVNNVECSSCHALYQVNLVGATDEGPRP